MSWRSFVRPGCSAMVLLAAATAAAAQDVNVGARIGVNLSTFAGDSRLDSYRHGVNAGVLIDVGLHGPLRLETGLAWMQKGASGRVQGFEGAVPTRVGLHYLQAPLLLRLSMSSSASLRPSLVAGPAISLEVGCSHVSDAGQTAITTGCDEPDRPRTDWGVLVGGGLAFDIGRGTVLLEGRYDFGLRDLDMQDVEALNRTLGLTTAFTIPVRR